MFLCFDGVCTFVTTQQNEVYEAHTADQGCLLIFCSFFLFFVFNFYVTRNATLRLKIPNTNKTNIKNNYKQ